MRRVAVDGALLPNPRVVSEALRGVRARDSQGDTNVMFMMLGQFIDHDLVSVPVATGESATIPRPRVRPGGHS